MRKLSKKDRHGIALIVVAVLIVLTLGIASLSVRDDSRYDPVTFCPEGQDYAHTLVLVDKTDPLTPSQIHFLKQLALTLKDELAPREKLSIYVLDNETYGAPQARFAKCNPGSGKDANALYQNPELIRRKFNEFFSGPLEGVFDELAKVAEADHSPILEMIQRVSFVRDFVAKDQGEGARRHMIIVSDMLQNMPQYSHYRDKYDFKAFSITSYAQLTTPTLRGVDVDIYYLWRPKTQALQNRRHIAFWEEYFLTAGARLNSVTRIP